MYRFGSLFNLCGSLGLCIYKSCGLLEMYLGEGCRFGSGYLDWWEWGWQWKWRSRQVGWCDRWWCRKPSELVNSGPQPHSKMRSKRKKNRKCWGGENPSYSSWQWQACIATRRLVREWIIVWVMMDFNVWWRRTTKGDAWSTWRSLLKSRSTFSSARQVWSWWAPWLRMTYQLIYHARDTIPVLTLFISDLVFVWDNPILVHALIQ